MQITDAKPAGLALVEVGPPTGDRPVERPVEPLPAPVEAPSPAPPLSERVVRRLTKLVHRLERLVAHLEQTAAGAKGDDRRVARRIDRQLDKIERTVSHALKGIAGKLPRHAHTSSSEHAEDGQAARLDPQVGRALRGMHHAFRLELKQASREAAASEPLDGRALVASTREAFDRLVANLRSLLGALDAPEQPESAAAATPEAAQALRVHIDLRLMGENFESLVGGLGAQLAERPQGQDQKGQAGGSTTIDLHVDVAVELYQCTASSSCDDAAGLEVDAQG